jgi:hypothetical protein
VDQNWEALNPFGDPAHYNYILRDFAYEVGGGDIVKTDSLITPYKGYIELIEKLYVERYHTPDASDPSIFFYTMTTLMKVNFEYRENGFVFTNIQNLQSRLDQGWPKEIIYLRNKYGEKFRPVGP